MTVVFGLGVSVGVWLGGCVCGFERCESGGVSGCLGFEGASCHVGLVADVVVLVAGGVEERRGGLGGERARSLFSTRLLQRVRECFCIHPFFCVWIMEGDSRWGLGRYFYGSSLLFWKLCLCFSFKDC